MALTVRLDPQTERKLNALAKRRGQTRSFIVREAIERYAASETKNAETRSTYDDWADIIGIGGGGFRDPRKTTGEQFTEIVREKARRRRAR